MSKSTFDIRKKFLNFFYEKGHKIIESSSLIPYNDSSLLFTNSGMHQFKDIFLGKKKSSYENVATAQRCLRAGGKHNDLENVGYTPHHHTFFEMLGNFSFGSYFKNTAIKLAWELLTDKKWFNLPKNRLWATVYHTDKETFDIWKNDIDIPSEHIVYIDDNKGTLYESDNFWKMSETGPCGPCTEIFFDHGENIIGNKPGQTHPLGYRYIEIWNIVFIQFNRLHDGTMHLLSKPSVDTGMGLERITSVMQGVHSNYEIDIFSHLIQIMQNIMHINSYKENASLYIIADHIRAAIFLVSDGLIPSNEKHGYVLRRIIRRAVHHGVLLGCKNLFFYKLIEPSIDIINDVNIKNKKNLIVEIIKREEENFLKTLSHGLDILNKKITQLKNNVLEGSVIFELYDTFGFPPDLTYEICKNKNIKIEKTSFKKYMLNQKLKSKNKTLFLKKDNTINFGKHTTIFTGYESLKSETSVKNIFIDQHESYEIKQKQEGIIILQRTPFYSESGGQLGDVGILKNDIAEFIVFNTKKYNETIIHIGKLISGCIKIGDTVHAIVNKKNRIRISRNHSATHLLHATLIEILGNHVKQMGSLINKKYFRFDFSHFENLNTKNIQLIENIVNKKIRKNILIETKIMPLDVAKNSGVITLFEKKYKKNIRVVKIKDFSQEACGGTHVNYTGDIGLFHILSTSSISSGIRRIEAVTGKYALNTLQDNVKNIKKISTLLQVNNHDIYKKICFLVKKYNLMEQKLRKIEIKEFIVDHNFLIEKIKQIKKINVLIHKFFQSDIKLIHILIKFLKEKINNLIIIFFVIKYEKVSLIISVTQDLVKDIKASDIIKNITKKNIGHGGGNYHLAQAGGINVHLISEIEKSIKFFIKMKLEK